MRRPKCLQCSRRCYYDRKAADHCSRSYGRFVRPVWTGIWSIVYLTNLTLVQMAIQNDFPDRYLSVVVPAYDEEMTLTNVVGKLRQAQLFAGNYRRRRCLHRRYSASLRTVSQTRPQGSGARHTTNKVKNRSSQNRLSNDHRVHCDSSGRGS
jgi:hypothetical protein